MRFGLALLVIIFALLAACSKELSSEEHFQEAQTLLNENNPKQAIVELKSALQRDVTNTRARTLLGRIYFDLGQWENAEKELTKALASGVDTTAVLPILAQTLLSLGEYQRLEELPLEGLDPKNRSVVQAAKGLAQLYQGNEIVAGEIIRNAMRNESISPYAKVASARYSMATNAFKRARLQLSEVFEDYPEYDPAWNLLGDIEATQKNPKAAEEAYSKVLRFASSSYDARLNRAMMRIYQGNFKGAREDLIKIKTGHGWVASIHPGVHFAWGIVYLHNKQMGPARKSFEKASEFSDAYPLTFYYLAAIDLEQGLVQQAISNVYRFLGLVPGSVVGAKLAAMLELHEDNFIKAEELLQPIVESRPNDSEALNLMASALIGQDKGGEGVELLTRVAKLRPKSTEAKARLGAGYLSAGEEALGISKLQEILKVDPSYEQADILIVLNYLRQNEPEKAIEAAEQYLARHPASLTSFNLLGRAYLANKETAKARETFARALRLDPADPSANNSMAALELKKKKYKAARKFYDQVLQVYPGHLLTMMNLAASYALEGDEASMFDSLDSALEIHPRAMEPKIVKARYYLARGELEKAGTLLGALTEAQREDPDVLATTAGFELATGRYNQALITLDKLIAQRKDVGQYHYMKAKAYAGLEDEEKFSKELRTAIRLDPKHFYAKIALARLLLLHDKTREFRALLSGLKKSAPDNPDVIKLQIAAAEKRGDNKAVTHLLEKLFQQSPTTSVVLAIATQKIQMGNEKGAIKGLESWAKDFPSDLKVREHLAELYSQTDQYDKLIDAYRDILDIDQDHLVALNNLAWYLREKDPEESLQYAERAFTLSPKSGSILDTLALVQLKNNRVIEARRSINRALDLMPDNPDLKFHAAQIAVAEGDKVGAAQTLKDILQAHDEFRERRAAAEMLKELL